MLRQRRNIELCHERTNSDGQLVHSTVHIRRQAFHSAAGCTCTNGVARYHDGGHDVWHLRRRTGRLQPWLKRLSHRAQLRHRH